MEVGFDMSNQLSLALFVLCLLQFGYGILLTPQQSSLSTNNPECDNGGDMYCYEYVSDSPHCVRK
jgi:hypothetical protein